MPKFKVIKNTLVILTKNEVEGLRSIVHKIPFNLIDEVIAIDCNSTDGTRELLKKHHIRVITQKEPGRTYAMKLAAEIAKGENVVFLSSDGNENPADVPRLLALLDSCDLAIGSRFLTGGKNEEDDQFFRLRAWANQFFNLLANVLWNRSGIFVTDTTNGIRAIKKKALASLNIDAKGFVSEYQMTIRAMKKNLKIREIPTIEGARVGGEVGAKSIPTGILFIKYLIREILIGKHF